MSELLCELCGIAEVTQTTEPHPEHGEVLVSRCDLCDFSYYQEPEKKNESRHE